MPSITDDTIGYSFLPLLPRLPTIRSATPSYLYYLNLRRYNRPLLPNIRVGLIVPHHSRHHCLYSFCLAGRNPCHCLLRHAVPPAPPTHMKSTILIRLPDRLLSTLTYLGYHNQPPLPSLPPSCPSYPKSCTTYLTFTPHTTSFIEYCFSPGKRLPSVYSLAVRP